MGITWWGLLLAGIFLSAVTRISLMGVKTKTLGRVLRFASWFAFSGAIYTSGLLSGSAAWLRLIIAIVVGLIANQAALLAWMKVMETFKSPNGDEQSEQALDQAMREKGFAVTSHFPLCNDTGHLICKNCGVPYDTATLDGALAQFKGPGTTVFITNNCTRCGIVSIFKAMEIKKGRKGK